jgi:hypothetical protein
MPMAGLSAGSCTAMRALSLSTVAEPDPSSNMVRACQWWSGRTAAACLLAPGCSQSGNTFTPGAVAQLSLLQPGRAILCRRPCSC